MNNLFSQEELAPLYKEYDEAMKFFSRGMDAKEARNFVHRYAVIFAATGNPDDMLTFAKIVCDVAPLIEID